MKDYLRQQQKQKEGDIFYQHMKIQKNIMSVLKQMDKYNINKKKTDEQKYIKSFLLIFQKIKKELNKVEEQYNPVDIQKKKQNACSRIKQQLDIRKKRCIELKQLTKQAKHKLNQENKQNMCLQAEKKALIAVLVKKSDQKIDFKLRADHLESSPLFNSKNSKLKNLQQEKQTKLIDQRRNYFIQNYKNFQNRNNEQMRYLLSHMQFRRKDQLSLNMQNDNSIFKTISHKKRMSEFKGEQNDGEKCENKGESMEMLKNYTKDKKRLVSMRIKRKSYMFFK